MIKILLSDFSNVLLFAKNSGFTGGLNELFAKQGKPSDKQTFWQMYRVNQDLLDFYFLWKEQYHLQVFIYTSGIVHQHVALKPILSPVFDGMYSVAEIQKQKDDPHSYQYLAEKLKVDPAEIIFIDDSRANIEAAASAGIQAVLYVNNELVKEKILEKIED